MDILDETRLPQDEKTEAISEAFYRLSARRRQDRFFGDNGRLRVALRGKSAPENPSIPKRGGDPSPGGRKSGDGVGIALERAR